MSAPNASSSLPPDLPRGRYRHYKGNDYEIIATATHSELGEPLVLYRALYGAYGLWVRPLHMFHETVTTEDGRSVARFAFMGPDLQSTLSPGAWNAARAFLTEQARPLERALYNWRFEGGDPAAVFVALHPYQNADGGFGNGLEPDLALSDSSVLATSRALQLLRRLGATAEEPMVVGALAWLRSVWDAERDRWPLIPGNTDAAPHAPWWSPSPDHDDQFGGYLINPRLEIIGYLWQWGATQDREWLAGVSESAVAHLEALSRTLDQHEIHCCGRFAASPGIPGALRDRVIDATRSHLVKVVASTAEGWGEYTLQPLAVAPDPLSPFAVHLSAWLPANLDFRIATQQEDGAWHPAWSWFGMYDEEWPSAREAWKGIITFEALEQLSAWGRVSL